MPTGLCRYSIGYDPAVVEAIRKETTREPGYRASEAEEAYGLLWGTHEGIKIEILACSPLSPAPRARNWDQSSGPPLIPRLRRALYKTGKPGLVPLGFYRAVDVVETTFSEEEARALAELFPRPWQFAMLLGRTSDLPVKIRLFFHLRGGSIGTDLGVFELSADGVDALVETGGCGFPLDDLGESKTSPGLLKFRRPPRRRLVPWQWRFWWQSIWFVVGIAVLGAAIEFRIGHFYNPGLTAPASEQRASGNRDLSDTAAFPLHADVRESKAGAIIRLQWDPLAGVIRNSPVGILSVSDGNTSRQFVFKRRELDLGYTDYPPASDEITFRLMVEDGGGPKLESLLVLLSDGGAAESDLSPHPPGKIRRSGSGESSQASLNARPQQPSYQTDLARQARNAPSGVENPDSSPDGAAETGHGGSIARESGSRQPALNSDAVPPIPQQVSSLPPSTASQLGIQQIPVAPPPPAPSNTSRSRLEFIAPTLVRRVPPALPYSVQRLAADDLRIKVRVDVDANGRVTACRPISSPSGVNKYLAAVARDTVMQWRFSPGRLGGKPVASETVLDLDFSNVH
ncbi:MAG: energy transducer TonB [Bryobacteraceae bacterium]